MKKEFQSTNKMSLRPVFILTMFSVSLALGACSSSYERGEELVAADEMKAGPGIFSGQKGGFYLVGGEEEVTATKPISKMNLDETSRVLDEKIEQLKRDQKELETLKLELNKKLKK